MRKNHQFSLDFLVDLLSVPKNISSKNYNTEFCNVMNLGECDIFLREI